MNRKLSAFRSEQSLRPVEYYWHLYIYIEPLVRYDSCTFRDMFFLINSNVLSHTLLAVVEHSFVNLRNSRLVFGGFIANIALTFLAIGSIVVRVILYPRYSSSVLPNDDFLALTFSPACCNH